MKIICTCDFKDDVFLPSLSPIILGRFWPSEQVADKAPDLKLSDDGTVVGIVALLNEILDDGTVPGVVALFEILDDGTAAGVVVLSGEKLDP